jgi:TPR repeat protein
MHLNESAEEMGRHGLVDKNVVGFPRGADLRLENAIESFDAGDSSPELFKEFIDLIDKGLKEANYFVGCMYEDGTNGTVKNLAHAFHYYQKSVEGFGYLEGYLAQARLLYHGNGIAQDYERAFQYYRHVVEQREHPVALFMLGRMFQHGTGVKKDIREARVWYGRAIAAGSIYGMINLAMLEYEEGHHLKSLLLRIKAGINAFLLARRNPRDVRLRGG